MRRSVRRRSSRAGKRRTCRGGPGEGRRSYGTKARQPVPEAIDEAVRVLVSGGAAPAAFDSPRDKDLHRPLSPLRVPPPPEASWSTDRIRWPSTSIIGWLRARGNCSRRGAPRSACGRRQRRPHPSSAITSAIPVRFSAIPSRVSASAISSIECPPAYALDDPGVRALLGGARFGHWEPRKKSRRPARKSRTIALSVSTSV